MAPILRESQMAILWAKLALHMQERAAHQQWEATFTLIMTPRERRAARDRALGLQTSACVLWSEAISMGIVVQ